MKLYKEVLIETAEQAEALPAFTVARYIDGDVRAAIKTVDGIWESVPGFYGEEANFSEDLVGWTALVPIEAEERIGSEMCHQISDKRYDIHVLPAGDEKQASWQIENNPDYATGRIMRQYRTPWEEA